VNRSVRGALVFVCAIATGMLAAAVVGDPGGPTTAGSGDRATGSPAAQVVEKEAPPEDPSQPPAAEQAAIPEHSHPPPAVQPGYSDAEQVARRFLEGYASFDWRDPEPMQAVRQRTRPWATPELNSFLDGGSSAAHLTEQRVQAREVATVEIVSMDPVSPKGPELVTFVSLGLNHKAVDGPTPEPRAQFFELTVVLRGDRWLVDRIRL